MNQKAGLFVCVRLSWAGEQVSQMGTAEAASGAGSSMRRDSGVGWT